MASSVEEFPESTEPPRMQESEHTGCLPSTFASAAISSRPLPSSSGFLKLPREIRDCIYYYTLISRPSEIVTIAISSQISDRWWQKISWGTEKSTRLFRVNRQVASEASDLFYSLSCFQFKPSVNVRFINSIFRDNVTVGAREKVKSLHFQFFMTPRSSTSLTKREERNRNVLETTTGLLPRLGREGQGRIYLGSKIKIPQLKQSSVVRRAISMLGPMKDIPGVTLQGWKKLDEKSLGFIVLVQVSALRFLHQNKDICSHLGRVGDSLGALLCKLTLDYAV